MQPEPHAWIRLRHSLTRVLPYTPAQLFTLVGDVEAYPQFVPWVTRLTTFNRACEDDGVVEFDAEAVVGFSFVQERFCTHVRLDSRSRVVDVALLSGPFSRLTNRWSLAPHPGGATLTFDIDFAFKSRLLDGLLAANFERAVNRLVACFEDRAKVLYG